MVLTKKHLLTFKDELSYKNPTEVIEMQECKTVKTADEESYKPNSLVSYSQPALLIKLFLETGSGRVNILHVCGERTGEGVVDRCFGQSND